MNENIIPLEVQIALQEVQDPIIFELGTCDGYHSPYLLKACRGKPRMFAFEPDPRNTVKCAPVLRALNATFVPAAVGNVTAKVPFHLAHADCNNLQGSSSISTFKDQSKVFPWCTEIGVVEVMCWRMDDYCKQQNLDHIDFIWMDVQGAERMVIEGIGALLPRVRYIYTEYEGIDEAHEGTCYADSSSLERILKQLPGWQMIKNYAWDALLKNPRYA